VVGFLVAVLAVSGGFTSKNLVGFLGYLPEFLSAD